MVKEGKNACIAKQTARKMKSLQHGVFPGGHPSTNPARQGLTSVIGRELVLSLWYGRRHLKGM